MAWCFNGLVFYLYKEKDLFSIHFQRFQGKNMKLRLREVFLLTAMLLRTLHSVCCGTFIEGLHVVSFNHTTYSFTVQSDVKLIQ